MVFPVKTESVSIDFKNMAVEKKDKIEMPSSPTNSVVTRYTMEPLKTYADPDLEAIAASSMTYVTNAGWNKLQFPNPTGVEPDHVSMKSYLTGVDGVMIARGAIGNPWIFSQVSSHWKGEPAEVPTIGNKRDMISEHLRRLVKLNEIKQAGASRETRYKPEVAACKQFRTHIVYYVKGMYDKRQLLQKLAELETVDSIMKEVDILMEKNK